MSSSGRILSSAMWAEDRHTHCTSLGGGVGTGEALGFAIGKKREGGRAATLPSRPPKTQQHLPHNFSAAFSFHLNSFPSFPLVQPPTQVVLHHAKWAQQSQLHQHQPTQHRTDQPHAHHLQTFPKSLLTRSASTAPSAGWEVQPNTLSQQF